MNELTRDEFLEFKHEIDKSFNLVFSKMDSVKECIHDVDKKTVSQQKDINQNSKDIDGIARSVRDFVKHTSDEMREMTEDVMKKFIEISETKVSKKTFAMFFTVITIMFCVLTVLVSYFSMMRKDIVQHPQTSEIIIHNKK